MAENRFSGFQGAFQPDAPFAFPTSGGDNRFAAFATNDFGIDFSAPAAVVREQIAALPEEQRRPATEAWAREYVEREREEGGIGYAVNNRLRAAGRGTVVGSFLDEANSLTQSGLYNLTGGAVGSPYDESQAYQAARDRAFDEANPVESIALQLGGAVASAPFTPVARVMQGTGMGAQAVNLGITGLGYGTLYGSGLGDTVDERASNAVLGAAIGGPLGAVTPYVARGVGSAVGYAADRIRGVPDELTGFSRGAVQRVARGAGDDGMTTLPEYQSRSAPLGREGMLLDMGDNMLDQAGAIANSPGAGQSTLRTGLRDRRAGAQGRIVADTNAALGPRQNLVELGENLRQTYGARARPLYDEFYASAIPTTRTIENVFSRVQDAAPSAIGRSFRLISARERDFPIGNFFARLNPDGSVAEIKRMPSAMEWDYIKRALDGMRRQAIRSGADDEASAYTSLIRDLRSSIDGAISPGAPQNSPWARARAISGEEKGIEEAIEAGQEAFRKQLSVDEMQAAMRTMSAAEQEAYRIGARAQIDEVMRNSGTTFGPTGDSAARRMLGNDAAREKLGVMAGDDSARRLVDRLEAETTFERSRQAIEANSATPRRLAAQAEFPSRVRDPIAGSGQTGVYGRLEQGALRIINAFMSGAIQDRNARIAADSARMLAAQGASRDEIARGLINYMNSVGMSQEGRQAIERLARGLMTSTRPAAIESAAQ